MEKYIISNELKDISLLIAEDDPTSRFLMKEHFKMIGFDRKNATFVSGGYEAIDTYNKHKSFDMVFMDIRLPGVNGIEAARSILQNIDSDARIVFTTAYTSRDTIQKCYASGALDVMIKPYKWNDLRETILKYSKKTYFPERKDSIPKPNS